MQDNPKKYHRRSIQIKGYEYSLPGPYIIPVVTWHRIYLFAEVIGGEMRLNEFDKIVTRTWEWLPQQYPYIKLDPYIVMPNHFHGILHIVEINDDGRGGSRPASTGTNCFCKTNQPVSFHSRFAHLATELIQTYPSQSIRIS